MPNLEPYIISIALGLALCLLFWEWFGLSLGGLLTPGYFSFLWVSPPTLVLALGLALFIYLLSEWASKYFVLFGKRRFVFSIFCSLLLSVSLPSFLPAWKGFGQPPEFVFFGHIVPGILANSFSHSKPKETILSLVLASSWIHLILIALYGASVFI